MSPTAQGDSRRHFECRSICRWWTGCRQTKRCNHDRHPLLGPFPFPTVARFRYLLSIQVRFPDLIVQRVRRTGVPPQSRRGDSRRERRRKLAVRTTIQDQVSYPAVYVGELKAARAIAVTADLVRARQEGWNGIRLHKWPGHFRNAATLCERSRSSLIWAGSGMTQTRLAGMIQPISPRISGV